MKNAIRSVVLRNSHKACLCFYKQSDFGGKSPCQTNSSGRVGQCFSLGTSMHHGNKMALLSSQSSVVFESTRHVESRSTRVAAAPLFSFQTILRMIFSIIKRNDQLVTAIEQNRRNPKENVVLAMMARDPARSVKIIAATLLLYYTTLFTWVSHRGYQKYLTQILDYYAPISGNGSEWDSSARAAGDGGVGGILSDLRKLLGI